jgi:mannan endo-1,4-beta-mannosidase
VPEAEFRILGNGQEITIAADVQGKQAEAQLDEEMLKKIGAAADGKISLYTADTKLQENTALFNIEPRAENPLSVDDFESYAGLNSLLVSSWALNKESSCELSVTLSDEFVHNGDYSMKFDYKETRNGWAGCEFLKETDWSGCNALQFWVKPDGNNQKTVVQIKTSDGGTYEAYLQECPEYAASVEGILVTLPFSEFMDKGGKGSLTSETAASVIGIGLWVNAIPDSEAMDSSGQVRGALYYDDIKAIQVRTSVPVFEGVAKGMADGTAAVKTDRKVSGKKYLIPLISGAAALLSAGGLVWQVLEQKKRR